MHLKNLLFACLILASSAAEGASLAGSKKSLDKQQRMARVLGLPKFNDVEDIKKLLIRGELYELPREGETFYLDEKIGECEPMYAHLYRLTSPTVLKFLSELSRDFYHRFGGKRLKVTSLIRTVQCQRFLGRRNRNAVRPNRSAHVTGAAIDISTKDLSRDELRWMRRRLVELERLEWIEATEEYHQACFHIMVFQS